MLLLRFMCDVEFVDVLDLKPSCFQIPPAHYGLAVDPAVVEPQFLDAVGIVTEDD